MVVVLVLVLIAAALFGSTVRTRFAVDAIELHNYTERLDQIALHERTRSEHELMVKLQEKAMPASLGVHEGLDIAARYVPSRNALGGDWYDAFKSMQGTTHIGIGDVQGHDVEAAVQMAQVRLTLRGSIALKDSPSSAFRRFNSVWEPMGFERFATCLYMRITEAGVKMCRAGHHEAIRLRDGHAQLLNTPSNPPLGIFEDYEFEVDRNVDVRNGDTLLFYTDGLVEPDIDAGVEWVSSLLESTTPGQTADEIAQCLYDAVNEGTPKDDVAFIVVRVLELPSSLAV